MRSAARHSARLASSSGGVNASAAVAASVSAAGWRLSKSSHDRQQPSQQHSRCLSTTTVRRVDTRGPNDPPSHRNELSRRAEGQNQRRDGSDETPTTATQEADVGSAEGRATTEDRAFKTFRQRKKALNAAPQPPEIPSWFLDYNVKLHVDTPGPNRSATNAQALRVVDGETGHTLFVLPFYEAWPVPGMQSRTTSQPQVNQNEDDPKRKLDYGFFDSKFDSQKQASNAKRDGIEVIVKPCSEVYAEVNPHALLRWSILQAEAGIRAAFALASSPRSASKLDLSLVCGDADSHEQLDDFIEDLAAITEADLVRLDANDFADLASDHVSHGSDAPEAFSNLAYDVFGGYTSTPTISAEKSGSEQDKAFDEEEMDEYEEDGEAAPPSTFGKGSFLTLASLRKTLTDRHQDFARAMSKIGAKDVIIDVSPPSRSNGNSALYRSSLGVAYDEKRLSALLESLVNSPGKKRSAGSATTNEPFLRRFNRHKNGSNQKKGLSELDVSNQALWRLWRSSPGCWLPDVAGLLAAHVQGLSTGTTKAELDLELQPHPASALPESRAAAAACTGRTIVHVRDLKDLCNSRLGESIVRRLVSVVTKLRRGGQQIVIVGTSCCEESPAAQRPEEFRTVSIPAVFHMSKHDQAHFKPSAASNDWENLPPYSRIFEINLRHLGRMLSSLCPAETVELFSENAQRQLRLGEDVLDKEVLSRDMIQRIVLTAIGLSQIHAVSEHISASHIGLATLIIQRAAQTDRDWIEYVGQKKVGSMAAAEDSQRRGSSKASTRGPSKTDQVKKDCDKHESRLLPGVVDPQDIKTGFEQVHATVETIEALRTLTSLSLTRPEAFTYGVLASDRMSGCLMYGPPGTGKTLLAKAVAKESGATVLEVSGAQVYEKYVGEGEKQVRAVFTLAKKLEPCVIFIDEADAIFGSRSSSSSRNTHREIINQFLREWDGMDSQNCFIMVASNRPFDLDDAVLRRLPRRLLVDLPVVKDRESILGIHLRDEALDSTVSLQKLAEDTPLYSGSDLKNMCVAAALACVREENDLQHSKKDDENFKLPEKRTLSARHFDKALKEISASISEDMSSLAAIRKFDEQFGDRKGRRKRATYGFGMGESAVDESAVRVRQSPPP